MEEKMSEEIQKRFEELEARIKALEEKPVEVPNEAPKE